MDEIYYHGPGRRVLCAVGIDDSADISMRSIESGLDRARDEGSVIQLYGHIPGDGLDVGVLEAVLAGARDRGLGFFTYDQLADGPAATPGLALSFDDDRVDAWSSVADLFDAYQAKATFFVSSYYRFDAERKAMLRELARRGHAIGAHTVHHLRAPEYVEDFGFERYLDAEIRPDLELLRADGYAPIAFAYPFGARISELDRTLLGEFKILRSVSIARDWFMVTDGCPE